MASKNKVILKSIIVVREGKRVAPPIGKAFPLTDAEIKALDETNPTAYRDAVNEDEVVDLAEVMALGNSNTRPGPVKSGAGKTTAVENGADADATAGGGDDDDDKGDDDDAKPLTVKQIKAGLADLDADELTAALNAEREGENRPTAIEAYEGEIAKRAAAASGDDDL